MNHDWTECDDKLVFYVAVCEERGIPLLACKQHIAEKIGISLATFNMRISNSKAAQGVAGQLNNFSKNTEKVILETKNFRNLESDFCRIMGIKSPTIPPIIRRRCNEPIHGETF